MNRNPGEMKKSLTIGLWDLQELWLREYKKAVYCQVAIPKIGLSFGSKLWLWLSARIAPCNMVIRHFVILDLIAGKPEHARHIYRQMLLLSINGTAVWQESYMYWAVDTMDFLKVWMDKFFNKPHNHRHTCYLCKIWLLKGDINTNFSKTAYSDGRPCPIGDQPNKAYPELKEGALTDVPIGNITMRWGHKNNGDFEYTYLIDACPVGFNTHCNAKFYSVTVCNGVVNGFQWYDCENGAGDSNKYPGRFDKLKDMLQPCRIWSAFKLLIGVGV
jgi:hypothetical protein